jgi:hypothetical protein
VRACVRACAGVCMGACMGACAGGCVRAWSNDNLAMHPPMPVRGKTSEVVSDAGRMGRSGLVVGTCTRGKVI